MYGKTYAEVKGKRDETIDKLKSQKSLSTYSQVLFEDVIAEFITAHQSIVKDSTLVRYVEIADAHLYPDLGRKSILSFSQEDANQYVLYLFHSYVN